MVTQNSINNKPDTARTAKSVMVYDAAGGLNEIALDNGELIIGNTGNAPTAATIISTDSTITVTGGAGSIDLADVYSPDIGTAAVLAYLATASLNVTGDGTVASAYDTEVFDVGGDFASKIFTAPADGNYFVAHEIYITGITSSHTQYALYMVTSNRSYYWSSLNSYVSSGSGGDICFSGNRIADMDNGDTAEGVIAISGGTKVADINITSAITSSNFIRFS